MKNKILYWKPTILTGVFLVATLRYFPAVYPPLPSFLWSSSHNPRKDEHCGAYNFSESCINYEDDYANHYSFYDYIIRVPSFLMESLFVATFVSNWMFGRRPITNWHNPISAQIAEKASTYLPAGITILYKAGTFITSGLAGDRADGANHITSVAMSAILQASRIKLIEAGLYDSAMDRSPPIMGDDGEYFQNGQMRLIERMAMHTENGINYVVEAVVETIYVVMEAGITQFVMSDDNRLPVLTTLYRAADITEDILVRQLNEYAYYAERWVDIPAISGVLRFTGLALANNAVAVIGVEPKNTEVILQGMHDFFQGAVEGVGEVFQGAIDAIEELVEDIGNAIHIDTAQVDYHHGGGVVEVVDVTRCCGIWFFGRVPKFVGDHADHEN